MVTALAGNLFSKGFLFSRTLRQLTGRDEERSEGQIDWLIERLDAMADGCKGEDLPVSDQALLSDRYYSVARAASTGHYEVDTARIAEFLLRD